MKKIILISVLCSLFVVTVSGQNYKLQKTISDVEKGQSIQTKLSEKPSEINPIYTTASDAKALEINWQFTDLVSAGSKIVVSGESGYTFNSWWLNNTRVSLHKNNATPLWEHSIVSQLEYPIDMTSDGAFLALGYDSVVQIFSSSSQTLIWEKITNASIIGVKISPDGTMVYVVENKPDGQDKCYVSAYEIGNNDPLWQTTFSGGGTAFAASGNRSMLALCQYSNVNKMWILNAENGEIIFDTYNKNQNPPAFSFDGNILLTGDYNGYAYLYEYQETLGTYTEKWHFKAGGGGYSTWVVGMGVSADGSTVAIGTMVFITGGYFDGEIYVFNSSSPEPLWVFEHAGDMVQSVSLSDDGSLIAAAGWGPLDHSKPDFYLFRKQTNVPIFDINTNGSFFSVDISGDGKLCSVTGKAVHAREMGCGGLLFNIDSDPGGGTLAGNINVQNAKVEVQGIDDYYAYSNDDGNYIIKYIPAGSYSVKVSKVGYYPVTQDDVQISEADTTNLDFTLDETGTPPTSLMATHGANHSVLLNWNYDNPGGILGYNIYRKTIQEGQFPEYPLAFVENNVFEYEDAEVQPLKTYYYAVTALLEEDIESPYSNIAEGWMDHGFVINEISAYQGSTPVIDGTIDEGEWDDAFFVDASDFLGTNDNVPNPVGSVMMAFKVNEDMTELYVACINKNDSILEDHDEVALYIDDNNDGVYPSPDDDSEGNYWAAYYASGNQLKYRPIYNNGGVGTVFFLENPKLEISDETGNIVYEFMIPIGDDENWKINPNSENQSGLFSFTLDDPASFDGYWPCQNLQIFNPLGYGTITFGAEDEMPVAPDEVSIWWDATVPPILILLEWNQPDINDFDHFNVYIKETGIFELLSETLGTQLYYYTDNNQYKEFYVTTVDKAGNESSPSEIVIFDISNGISKVMPDNLVVVFPNPASNEVNFSFYNDVTSDGDLSVFDVSGNKVETIFHGSMLPGEHSYKWSVQTITPGIYFLKIRVGNTVTSKKFILMH